jgi:hypothetical protein
VLGIEVTQMLNHVSAVALGPVNHLREYPAQAHTTANVPAKAGGSATIGTQVRRQRCIRHIGHGQEQEANGNALNERT